jgi:hypothetical protein
MALFPMNPGLQPLGSFDVVDAELALIKGGEVMTFTTASRTNSPTETAATDVLDGYTNSNANLRVAATRASTSAQYPLMLADDGLGPNYFTLFGNVSGPLGLGSGSAVGPHTAAASGKVTLWDKPGLYAVSTDALAPNFLTVPGVVGEVVGFANGADVGKLAKAGSTNLVANTGVGTFVQLMSDPSLVSTPAKLVGATANYNRVVIAFHAGLGLRTVS